MRLTATSTLLNGTIAGVRMAEGPICEWTIKWIQNGVGSCKPKAGNVRIYNPCMGFLPIWQMENAISQYELNCGTRDGIG
jgi:hypothetical protein